MPHSYPPRTLHMGKFQIKGEYTMQTRTSTNRYDPYPDKIQIKGTGQL